MKTVNIEDDLHRKLKIEAARSEKEIKDVVAEALKEYLTRKNKGVK
jgi:plasmid stability protein